MTEQGKARHRALADRLKAKRQAREAELKRRGAGESEMCEQDADLTRMEELETEVHIILMYCSYDVDRFFKRFFTCTLG